MLEAVIVAPLDRGRTIEQKWNAVVRSVIRACVQVAQRQTGRSAETECQRRSDSKAAAFSDIASGVLGVVSHQVQAECCALAQRLQRLVVIEGDALGLICAKVQRSGHESVDAGNLGFLIDHAAG